MKYPLIIGLCLSVLLLSGCGLLMMYIFADTAYFTTSKVEDSETNRLKVTQVVRLIADRYSFEDRSEEYRARNEQGGLKGYTYLAKYYAAGSDKPSDAITISAYAIEYDGKVYADLFQKKWGKATKKYTEIQDRWVSVFKERFGKEVDIEISGFRP